MHKIYILLFCSALIFSQAKGANFSPDQDSISGNFTADEEEHKIKILINTELEALTLKWRVLKKDMPSEWNNSLCDNFQCYFDVGTGTQKTAQPIGGGTPLPMEAGVNANNVGGEGKLIVKVFDEADSTNADTISFYWNMTVSTPEVEKPNFNIYPNPASSTLNIKFDKALKDDVQVKIYNLVGQEQRNIEVFQDNRAVSIDLRKLNNGTYLVQFINSNGKMVTQRFTKRM
ncbi:MAG: T9SS type A sorting domain-containing protein [Bacteroidia bacterium]